jgi:hypothetical protein
MGVEGKRGLVESGPGGSLTFWRVDLAGEDFSSSSTTHWTMVESRFQGCSFLGMKGEALFGAGRLVSEYTMLHRNACWLIDQAVADPGTSGPC